MSAHATQATQPNDPGPRAADAAAAHAADAQQHRQALRDLINMGTDFARLLHGQATAHAAQAAQQPPTPAQQAGPQPEPPGAAPQPAAAPAPAPESAPRTTAALATLAAAFDTTARTVRRCILLAQALDKPAPDPARQRTAARKRIIRKVEDVIQRPCFLTGQDRDRDTAEALRAELHERLDAPDLDDDIATRPVADIIEEIIRDLGLDRMPGTRPFQRRTPADVALLHARAAAPSGTRQPGATQPAARPNAGPQGPQHGATRPAPDPQPDRHGPDQSPAARAQPGPTRPVPVGPGLPDDPAEAVAFVLRHGARADARWHPPPGG